MSKPPDGGPAFGHGAENGHCCGMTLRDYFAGQALMGLLGRSTSDVPHCDDCRQAGDDAGAHYADISYRYADAMLAARSATRPA